jgi:DNA-binding transcriptional MerR regulator
MNATLRTVGPDAADEFTIDQLAQASGVTVRNIRAHQSRGLLPAPQVRGRTGFYNQEHVARLQLINEMQADGFNLNAIRRILDGLPPGSAGQVLGLEQALRSPWGEEQPEIMEAAELVGLVGDADDATTKKAIRLGILVPLGDSRYEVPSPSLLRAGAELNDLGIDIPTRLAVLEQIRRHTEGVADSFVRLFLEKVWKPFNDAGRPEADWPRVHEAINRMRPLATEALVATFHQVMAGKVDEAFGKVIQQDVKPRRPEKEARKERQPNRPPHRSKRG